MRFSRLWEATDLYFPMDTRSDTRSERRQKLAISGGWLAPTPIEAGSDEEESEVHARDYRGKQPIIATLPPAAREVRAMPTEMGPDSSSTSQ
jgi:hypothetical protein